MNNRKYKIRGEGIGQIKQLSKMPWYLQHLGEKQEDKNFFLMSILHLFTANFPTNLICFHYMYLLLSFPSAVILKIMNQCPLLVLLSLEKRTFPVLRLCLPKILKKYLEIGWPTWLWKHQLLFYGLQPHDREPSLGKKRPSRHA